MYELDCWVLSWRVCFNTDSALLTDHLHFEMLFHLQSLSLCLVYQFDCTWAGDLALWWCRNKGMLVISLSPPNYCWINLSLKNWWFFLLVVQTTLLTKLLHAAKGSRIAVLVNDLAEVGICWYSSLRHMWTQIHQNPLYSYIINNDSTLTTSINYNIEF